MVNVDGTELKTISDDQGKLVHQDWPSWSPDGRRFAFSSTHDGNQEIYTAMADGTDLVRLTQSPGLDAHPCWSPDGRKIAFATDRWGGLELASVRTDGTELIRLTTSTGLDDYPAFSPDGSRWLLSPTATASSRSTSLRPMEPIRSTCPSIRFATRFPPGSPTAAALPFSPTVTACSTSTHRSWRMTSESVASMSRARYHLRRAGPFALEHRSINIPNGKERAGKPP